MISAHFDRTMLPSTITYFNGQGLRLIGRGAWRSTRCCFHEDARPSLRINVETGAYKCMACGAKGGDVLDFHRARHGLSFPQAARDLGAWR